MVKKPAKKTAKTRIKIPKSVVRDLEPKNRDQDNIKGGGGYRGSYYQP